VGQPKLEFHFKNLQQSVENFFIFICPAFLLLCFGFLVRHFPFGFRARRNEAAAADLKPIRILLKEQRQINIK
jgi:hypothetical protein